MPKQIDMTEVSVAMAAMRTRTESQREAPGTKGVIVRLQYDVAPELTFWRAREINRGTPVWEIQESIITLFAATVMGEIRALTDDPGTQIELITESLKGFARSLGLMVADQKAAEQNAVVIHGHEQH